MRLPLLLSTLLALAASALAAAPAAAQASPQYAVILAVAPPADVLNPDAPGVEVRGLVTFVGDPTALLNLAGVPVSYQVAKAPAWAEVSIAPQHDVIQLTWTGNSVVGERPFTVTVVAAEGAPSETAVIEIVATTMPTTPQTPPKSAAQSFPVRHVAPEPEEECPEEAHVETYALFPAPEEDMTVQTGGVTPVATRYAVGAFMLAGAAIGFALLRRRGA